MKWARESGGKRQKPITMSRHKNKEDPEKGREFMDPFVQEKVRDGGVLENSNGVILSNL